MTEKSIGRNIVAGQSWEQLVPLQQPSSFWDSPDVNYMRYNDEVTPLYPKAKTQEPESLTYAEQGGMFQKDVNRLRDIDKPTVQDASAREHALQRGAPGVAYSQTEQQYSQQAQKAETAVTEAQRKLSYQQQEFRLALEMHNQKRAELVNMQLRRYQYAAQPNTQTSPDRARYASRQMAKQIQAFQNQIQSEAIQLQQAGDTLNMAPQQIAQMQGEARRLRTEGPLAARAAARGVQQQERQARDKMERQERIESAERKIAETKKREEADATRQQQTTALGALYTKERSAIAKEFGTKWTDEGKPIDPETLTTSYEEDPKQPWAKDYEEWAEIDSKVRGNRREQIATKERIISESTATKEQPPVPTEEILSMLRAGDVKGAARKWAVLLRRTKKGSVEQLEMRLRNLPHVRRILEKAGEKQNERSDA